MPYAPSGVYIPDPQSIEKLYQGSLVGSSLAKSIGTGVATGGDINDSVRAGLLNAGIASGKISAASLSPEDTQLLKSQQIGQAGLLGDINANPLAPSKGGGGVLGAIGSFIGGAANTVAGGVADVANVVGENATGLANTAVGIPQGLFTLGKSFVENMPGEETVGAAKPSVPSPTDIAKSMVTGTVRDFTHVTPGTIYRPLLDIASVGSGGAGLAGKAGEGLGRLAEGAEAGSTIDKLASAAQRVMSLKRPDLEVHPDAVAQTAGEELQAPSVPRSYSIAPFRQQFVEKPTDALMQSPPGQLKLPVIKKSLADYQAKYVSNKGIDQLRGHIESGATSRIAKIFKGPLGKAATDLRTESLNDSDYLSRFDAMALNRQLIGRADTPEVALQKLDQYRQAVLSGEADNVEGVASQGIKEDQQIRQFRNQQYQAPAFREYFSNPTEGMKNLSDAWDEDIAQNQAKLGIDPATHIERSLQAMAHVTGKSTDELLGEMPDAFKASGTLAKGLSELTDEIVHSGGKDVPQEALLPRLAQSIPGPAPYAKKFQVLQDAVESFKSDILGHDSIASRTVTNPRYLPGRTLNAKVGQALVRDLGIDPHIAERFMAAVPVRGAEDPLMPTYFPSVDMNGMKLMNTRGPLGRARRLLTGQPQEQGLREFGGGLLRGPTPAARIIRAESVGMRPNPGFLKDDPDLTAFKAGIDRRDPQIMARHVMQRERHLVATELAPKFFDKLSVKAADGSVRIFQNDADLVNTLGSKAAAKQFVLVARGLTQRFVVTEDHAIVDAIEQIRQASVEARPLNPDEVDQVTAHLEASAQQFVREALGEANQGSQAIPVESWNRLVAHAKILDSVKGPLRFEQGFINLWRRSVLSYMPSWFLRTTIGHGLFLFISGTSTLPLVTRFARLAREGGEDTEPIEYPYGVEQGAMESQFGEHAAQGAMNRLKPSAMIQGGVHNVMNFQRRAAFLQKLEKTARKNWGDITDSMDRTVPFFRKFQTPEDVNWVIRNHPDWVHSTVNELDRVSYTFGQMAPWERQIAKYVMPFWGWYKFASKFTWSLPFTYPGRANLLSKLGQLGINEQNQLGPIPDWLRNSVLFDTHNMASAKYLSMSGLNPMGDVLNPLSGSIPVQLGQLNPLTQAFLEGMGYNTLTGGLEGIDPSSGIVSVDGTYYNSDPNHPQEYDTLGGVDFAQRFIGNLMRAFPQVRDAELAYTRGRNVYPESIPFFNEKLVPTTNPKPESTGQLFGEMFGIAPKQYNLQDYGTNLLKKVVEASHTKAHDLAKQKALNP